MARTMGGSVKSSLTRLLLFVFLCSTVSIAQAGGDPLLASLQTELHRSFANLKKQPVPVYFLAYQLTDNHAIQVTASFGALASTSDQRTRLLDVDLRVGDYTLDNTHAGETGYSMASLAASLGR